MVTKKLKTLSQYPCKLLQYNCNSYNVPNSNPLRRHFSEPQESHQTPSMEGGWPLPMTTPTEALCTIWSYLQPPTKIVFTFHFKFSGEFCLWFYLKSALITTTTVDASCERHTVPFNHFYCHLCKIFSFDFKFSRELCLCTNLKSSALGRKTSDLVPWEGCFRVGLVLL